MAKAHTRHSHSVVNNITNPVAAEREDLAKARQSSDNNSIRHLSRALVNFHKNSAELGVTKKNFEPANNDTIQFQGSLLMLEGTKGNHPRTVGITTLDRRDLINVEACLIKGVEDVLAGTDSVHRKVN